MRIIQFREAWLPYGLQEGKDKGYRLIWAVLLSVEQKVDPQSAEDGGCEDLRTSGVPGPYKQGNLDVQMSKKDGDVLDGWKGRHDSFHFPRIPGVSTRSEGN